MASEELGQAEVHQLGAALAGDEQVGQLDVAVGDAVGVGVGQAGGGVLQDAQRLRRRQPLADLQDLAQVAALDELHDDGVLVRRLVVAHRQHLDDVGVLERLADAGLADEQVDALLVLAPAAAQHLDGDDAAAPRVLGPEDAAEAARGHLVQHPVAAQEIAVLVAPEEFAALPRR